MIEREARIINREPRKPPVPINRIRIAAPIAGALVLSALEGLAELI